MGQNSDRTKSGNIVMLKPLKMDISNNGVTVARPGKGANMATAMGGQLLRSRHSLSCCGSGSESFCLSGSGIIIPDPDPK